MSKILIKTIYQDRLTRYSKVDDSIESEEPQILIKVADHKGQIGTQTGGSKFILETKSSDHSCHQIKV